MFDTRSSVERARRVEFNPYEITGACDELFDGCSHAQELLLGW
jgi:hypothetical protein